MILSDILQAAIDQKASDVFILPGSPVSMRVRGKVIAIHEEKVMPQEVEVLIQSIYDAAFKRDINIVKSTGDDDFSFSFPSLGRFRCNAYKQRGTLAAVLRIVAFGLPDPVHMNIPDVVMNLADFRRGFVLVTGSAGSGKSTTLACLLDRINKERYDHIITLEDPIEFIHPHKNSIVSQREVPNDTQSYSAALRAALRQAPNVILLGEMRDHETIQTALTAAETGQLIFSTLHTVGASKTVDRIVDSFPAQQQQQIKLQLSMVLQGVVSQQLIPTLDGGMTPAFEVMRVNSAIQNLIRDGKMHQIDNVIFSGAAEGMQSMDSDLLRLYKEGKISKENAITYASNPDMQAKKINM